jgi:3-deoxy-D-manno-octulosonic-acid transferase
LFAVENKPEKQPGPRRQARRLKVAARKGYDVSMAVVGALARGATPLSRKLRELSGAFRPSSPPFFLWVHACSVGEMMVARRFIDCWRDKTGHDRIFLTAWTRDGHRIAESQIQPGETAAWFPLDSRAAMRRAYDTVQPKAVILCEAELWPNHLAEAESRGIPVFVINGRMSRLDHGKYARIGRMASTFFAIPEVVFAQSEQDAHRFSALGARRTLVTGNMKFDAMKQEDSESQGEMEFSGRPYLLAASSHPGEEAAVLKAFKECRAQRPDLKLVIAPRHVSRASEIARLARRHGLRTAVWPRDPRATDVQCVVVDRIGLLPTLYAGAEFAFVGKSLHARGGQNFLEAVQADCPVVVGPYTENFDGMLAPFLASGAVWQLHDAEKLPEAFRTLSNQAPIRDEMAKKARLVVRERSGATELTVREILSRL